LNYSWDHPLVLFVKLEQLVAVYYVLNFLEVLCCVLHNNFEALCDFVLVPKVDHFIETRCKASALVRRQYKHLADFHAHFLSRLKSFKQGQHTSKLTITFPVD